MYTPSSAHSKLEKGEKEVMLKEALSNAKLWEARYQAAEKSRQEYRENTRRIVIENERMQNAVNQVSHQYTSSSPSSPPHPPHPLTLHPPLTLLTSSLSSQTERDTVEVIAFLKREDAQKDEELSELKQQVT